MLGCDWPKEEIPSTDLLYYRVHRNDIRDSPPDAPRPNAFRKQGSGMSTDWSRYSDAAAARGRAVSPSDNAIAVLAVGSVREKGFFTVDHDPCLPRDNYSGNRAHSLVNGELNAKTRVHLQRASKWVEGFGPISLQPPYLHPSQGSV